jgi:hypothetical protein
MPTARRFWFTAILGVVVCTASIWWFWPLVEWQWYNAGIAAHIDWSPPARRALSSDPAPNGWQEVQFGPISVSLPPDLGSKPTLMLTKSSAMIHGERFNLTLAFTGRGDLGFIPFEELARLNALSPKDLSIFASRARNWEVAFVLSSRVPMYQHMSKFSQIADSGVHGFETVLRKNGTSVHVLELYPSDQAYSALLSLSYLSSLSPRTAQSIVDSVRLHPWSARHDLKDHRADLAGRFQWIDHDTSWPRAR